MLPNIGNAMPTMEVKRKVTHFHLNIFKQLKTKIRVNFSYKIEADPLTNKY